MKSHSRAALLPGWLWNGAADRNLLPNGKPIFRFFFPLFVYLFMLRRRRSCCGERNMLLFCVVTATLTKLGTEKVYGCHMHTFLQFCFHRNAESFAGLVFGSYVSL